jgi:hypothetical protein
VERCSDVATTTRFQDQENISSSLERVRMLKESSNSARIQVSQICEVSEIVNNWSLTATKTGQTFATNESKHFVQKTLLLW